MQPRRSTEPDTLTRTVRIAIPKSTNISENKEETIKMGSNNRVDTDKVEILVDSIDDIDGRKANTLKTNCTTNHRYRKTHYELKYCTDTKGFESSLRQR